MDGTVIENGSAIYFDFNPAVLTNSVSNTVVQTIPSVNISVTQVAAILTADLSPATYQWFYCDSIAISGATSQSYTATQNGSYSVAITESGCTDTSACYTVTGIGISENDQGLNMLISPNPTTGQFTIDLGTQYSAVNISISNILGQTISTQQFKNTHRITTEIKGPKGLYILEVRTSEGKVARAKLIKN